MSLFSPAFFRLFLFITAGETFTWKYFIKGFQEAISEMPQASFSR